MEKLPPSTGPGATPDVLAPAVPGVNPDQLALPAAPVLDLPPSAVSEAPVAGRPAVHFEVTTIPAAENAPVAVNAGKSEVIAPVDTWAAAMPAPEAVPPQTDRAAKVRNAARNAGRFATVAMEAAGALDRTGIPDALIDSGIGGRTGTIIRGAAKATKTAAKLNDARHKVEAALQPSPTGEGGNNEGPVASADSTPPQRVVRGRASVPQPGQGGTVYGRGAPTPPPSRYPGDPADRRAREERLDNPRAYGTWTASQEAGDDPRHLPLDPYLGLSPQEYATVMADTKKGADGLTGPERLANRAARMQQAAYERIRADRPVRGHRDVRTGEEIPYYGPAEGPLITGGKQRPAVDRSRPAIYGEPGAGWNPDPRVETARSTSPRHAYDEDARSLKLRGDKQPHGLTVPERVRGAVRDALTRVFRPSVRREQRNWDAAREAGFDEQERRGAQYRGAMSHDDIAARAKGFVDVGSSTQPITEGEAPKIPPKYAKLKFRNK